MFRFLLTVFIAVIIYYVLRGLWIMAKVFWNGYKIHKFMRDPIGEMNKRANKAYGRQQQNYDRTHQAETPVKKKKIDPNVGEYVAFTEIDVTETTEHIDGSTTTTEYHEQQITDIEWEDVPDAK